MTRRGQGWLAACVASALALAATSASAEPARLACHGGPPVVDHETLGEDNVNPPSDRFFDFDLIVDSAASTVRLDGGLPFLAAFNDERIVFTLPRGKTHRGVWGKAERLIQRLVPGATVTLNRKTGAFSTRGVEGACRVMPAAPNLF